MKKLGFLLLGHLMTWQTGAGVPVPGGVGQGVPVPNSDADSGPGSFIDFEPPQAPAATILAKNSYGAKASGHGNGPAPVGAPAPTPWEAEQRSLDNQQLVNPVGSLVRETNPYPQDIAALVTVVQSTVERAAPAAYSRVVGNCKSGTRPSKADAELLKNTLLNHPLLQTLTPYRIPGTSKPLSGADAMALVATAWGEARGTQKSNVEDDPLRRANMVLVMNTIKVRAVTSRFTEPNAPSPIAAEAMWPYQYSVWNAGAKFGAPDPNFACMATFGGRHHFSQWTPDEAAALYALADFLHPATKIDPKLKDCAHYVTSGMLRTSPPAWSRGLAGIWNPTVFLGDLQKSINCGKPPFHVFFSGVR